MVEGLQMGNLWFKPSSIGTKQVKRKTQQPSVKHGADSTMVLGCILTSSIGNITKIDQLMKQKVLADFDPPYKPSKKKRKEEKKKSAI